MLLDHSCAVRHARLPERFIEPFALRDEDRVETRGVKDERFRARDAG